MSKQLLALHKETLSKAATAITAAAPKSGNAVVGIIKKVLPAILPFLPSLIVELAPKLKGNKRAVEYLDEIIMACEQVKSEIGQP